MIAHNINDCAVSGATTSCTLVLVLHE